MPRRSILSAAERQSLLALPDSRDELIRRYTLSESDLSIIRQRRGAANRLCCKLWQEKGAVGVCPTAEVKRAAV